MSKYTHIRKNNFHTKASNGMWTAKEFVNAGKHWNWSLIRCGFRELAVFCENNSQSLGSLKQSKTANRGWSICLPNFRTNGEREKEKQDTESTVW